jgi:hypothetical protein
MSEYEIPDQQNRKANIPVAAARLMLRKRAQHSAFHAAFSMCIWRFSSGKMTPSCKAPGQGDALSLESC